MVNRIKNNTVLITGGTGNIGSHILDEILVYEPKEIVIVDNLFNSDKSNISKHLNDVIFYPFDISGQEEMDYVFDKHKPDVVFHCASMLIKDSELLPRKAIDSGIKGTYNIVELSNIYGVKKICYSSSASVYGEPLFLPVTEDHPFQHKNFVYGWVKIAAESIFLSHCQVPWLGFRYYNVYSERATKGSLYTQILPLFINKIMNEETVTIYGDGTQTMDMIHAKDIALANLQGMFSDVSGEFFNVGTGIETSVNDLVKYIGEFLNKKVEVKYIAEDSQKVKNRRSSTEKIKDMLGFEPEIEIKKGLEKIIFNLNWDGIH